ncbi:MAG: UDP-N-acetyl-D-mannosamine dehydrogenase [Verrucomicrobia bacterium]|nr:UDP-N-acetyl-D-mannosamine dehydrogenase [Verrucomicrobiota bacterium]
MKYDVCVIGLGYIGLPTASIFATRGLKVFGVDVRPDVVEIINAGGLHFHEPDLDVLVRAAVQSGNLRAGTGPQPADTFILAVPTPFSVGPKGEKIPDLSYVEQAARGIAPHVAAGNLVILESTSPVGTTELMRDWLTDERKKRGLPAVECLYAHCPERVLPGNMLKELVANDRIAGGLTPEAGRVAKELYQRFCTGEIFVSDARTAEMAKLTENSFRDVNIAFANELSLICERLNIDVWELIKLANRHPRVKILQPGPGVGGHCIAVDPWFIVHSAPEVAPLIRTAREVNDSKPHHIVARVKAAAAKLKDPVIACLGLAFKADIDDLRESPAMEITAEIAHGKLGRVLAVEPHVKTLPASLAKLGNVTFATAEDAVKQADIIVLLVNHRPFTAIDRALLRDKVVIDTRGFWR